MNYVIEVQDCDTNEFSYFAYDDHSGGYPWYPTNMFSAHVFSDLGRARSEYDEMVNASNSPMEWTDGTKGAPFAMRNYAKLNNNRTSGRFLVKLVALNGSHWTDIKPVIISAHNVSIQEFLKERKNPIVKSEKVL